MRADFGGNCPKSFVFDQLIFCLDVNDKTVMEYFLPCGKKSRNHQKTKTHLKSKWLHNNDAHLIENVYYMFDLNILFYFKTLQTFFFSLNSRLMMDLVIGQIFTVATAVFYANYYPISNLVLYNVIPTLIIFIIKYIIYYLLYLFHILNCLLEKWLYKELFNEK